MEKCSIEVFELHRTFTPDQRHVLKKALNKINTYFKHRNPMDRTILDYWYELKTQKTHVVIHPSRIWNSKPRNELKILMNACMNQVQMDSGFPLHYRN